MSAVAIRAGAELFWFYDTKYHRFHAFELDGGDLSSGSICGVMPLEHCDDVPEHDEAARKGRGCFFCLMLVAHSGRLQ